MKLPLPSFIQKDISLYDKTTLELGGIASYYAPIHTKEQALLAIQFSQSQGLPILPLGWGSNLVVGDGRIHGVVLHMKNRGIKIEQKPSGISYQVQAGEGFDTFVQKTVADNVAGLECLSGIPGTCGATPFQNVGAYGQEVSQSIRLVEAIELSSLKTLFLTPSECEFGYRTSLFRKNLGQYLILSVNFELTNKPSSILYKELEQLLITQFGNKHASCPQIRSAVLELRRKKSMVLDPTDENRRSVGSFFTNPTLTPQEFKQVITQSIKHNFVQQEEEIPHYKTILGYKIPAAWLIEKSGFKKGFRLNHVGISSKHSLCLVHHGQGQTKEIIQLARDIQRKVKEFFGILLAPEPIFWAEHLQGATCQINSME